MIFKPLRISALLTTGIVVLSCGCLLMRAKRDLSNLDRTVRMEGYVSCPNTTGKPICVTLYEDIPGEERKPLAAYRVLYASGAFHFYIKPGNYYLVAFEDANEDFTFQPDERIGWYGSPTLIKTEPGACYNGLSVNLNAPEAARKKLPELYANPPPPIRLNLKNKHVGTEAKLSDERFSPENAQLGMWEPLNFVDTYGGGLFFLTPYDTTKTPVLFIHGVGGTPRNFASLIDALDPASYQPWVLHYPSGLRLTVLSDALSNLLQEAQTRFGFKRLIVVAHSMGGLVACHAIQQLATQKQFSIPVFVSIATPWEGHQGAELGIQHSLVILPCWYDMAPGSPFLEDLRKTNLPSETRYYLFFGYKGSRPLFVDDNADGTVPLSSVLNPDMQNKAVKVLGFHATHADILKDPEVSKQLGRILALYTGTNP